MYKPIKHKMKKEDIKDLKISELIERFTIEDKEKIRTAKCVSNNVPNSMLRPLIPIGLGYFKGDNLPEQWSANSHFNKGEYYLIYGEENKFVISNTNDKGMKITPNAWKIKFF